MKKKFSFLALLALLAFGCKNDPANIIEPVEPKAKLDVNFKVTYDGVQLDKNKVYEYSGKPLQFYTFTLFISDFALLKGTEEVPLTEVEFMEFLSNSSGDQSATPKFTFDDIPAGDYTGFKLGFGVKTDLNAKRPSDFPAGHPLTNEVEYWLGWKSYIFSKIEAGLDQSGASGDYETFLNYHSGSSSTRDVYTFFEFDNQPFTIKEGTDSKTIVLDLKQLFYDSNGKLMDLSVPENQYTGTNPNDLHIAQFLMDNWSRATKIE